jgi:hypothetical protein
MLEYAENDYFVSPTGQLLFILALRPQDNAAVISFWSPDTGPGSKLAVVTTEELVADLNRQDSEGNGWQKMVNNPQLGSALVSRLWEFLQAGEVTLLENPQKNAIAFETIFLKATGKQPSQN